MNRAAPAFAAFALFAVSACSKPPAPPPAPAKTAPARIPVNVEESSVIAPIPDIDSDNLLNLGYGAALVSRTGELNLEGSALHAIDGCSFTAWTSSPSVPQQTLVFALGGPSRIEQLGVTTGGAGQSPQSVRFLASQDGQSWREVANIKPADKGSSIEDVKPFEARYLRVESIEPSEYYAAFTSVHAIGRELRAPERIPFSGCFTVNGHSGILTQRGSRITGILGGATQPTYVDGGIEGRVAKLMWMRGAMWGYAAATVTPGAREIGAITFHQEPRIDHASEAWIGSRCNDAALQALQAANRPASLPPTDFLNRARQWTLFGLLFDSEDHLLLEPSGPALDDAAALLPSAPSQRFRINVYEFRGTTAEENRRRATTRMESLREALRAHGVDVARIEFVARGNDRPDAETPSAVQRMLWSRVDLIRL